MDIEICIPKSILADLEAENKYLHRKLDLYEIILSKKTKPYKMCKKECKYPKIYNDLFGAVGHKRYKFKT